MNSKSIFVGFLMAAISFFFWSLIIPKALALFSNNSVLGIQSSTVPFKDNTINAISVSPTNLFTSPTPKTSMMPLATPASVLKSTPNPSPTPSPSASPVLMEQLDEWFTKYANKESINKDLLKKIAYCESEYKPDAINGLYGGMFQFTINTWISTRSSMNLNTDPNLRFNPEEAIKTAAFRIATQGSHAWPNCGK